MFNPTIETSPELELGRNAKFQLVHKPFFPATRETLDCKMCAGYILNSKTGI